MEKGFPKVIKYDLFQNSMANNGIPSIFILSTKACCEAINLTAATRVILFDVSWNPCHDEQAICRAFRIGQTKKVHIYRFVAQGTMEERVLLRQQGKKSISNRIVNNEKKVTKVKKSLLNQLFAYSEENFKPPTTEEIKRVIMDKDYKFSVIVGNFADILAKTPESVDNWFVNDNTRKLNKDEKDAAKRRYECEMKGMNGSAGVNGSAGSTSISAGGDMNGHGFMSSGMNGMAGRHGFGNSSFRVSVLGEVF